jgi:hypothetical protein
MIKFRTAATSLGVIAALSLGTACNGASPARVATLGDDATTTTEGSSANNEKDFRDALVDYSQCMRDHGVDMPDPTFDDSGGGGMAVMVGPGEGPDPDDATFKAAETACKPILDEAQKYAPRMSPEDEAKMRDQALKFAQCMREKGFDIPDPTFDDEGGMKIERHRAGDGSAPDSEPSASAPDPQFQEAAKECGAENGLTGGFRTGGEE